MIEDRLRDVIRLGGEIAYIKDLDLLMERILTEVRRFVRADAGSIYLRAGDRLEFNYTQNETLQRRLPKGGKLVYSTFSVPIDNTTIAGHVAVTGDELNIADVYELPASAPYSFGKEFDEKANYRTHSMFVLPLKTFRDDIVGVLQLINARAEDGQISPFLDEDRQLIRHFGISAAVALERAQITRTIFLRMIRMAELRDPKETGPHVNRVAAITTEIYKVYASRKQISSREVDRQVDVLRSAAMLHDVGKVGISDNILKKPARLTPEEYDAMKQHTLIGTRLFSDAKSEIDEAAAAVTVSHHERWDGAGYPEGKSGEDIPLFGRLVAIADVFDALSSRRSYKEAWDEDRVLAELRDNAGSQFDAGLVGDFLSIHGLIKSIRSLYPDPD